MNICQQFISRGLPLALADSVQARIISTSSLVLSSPYLLTIKNGIVSSCGGVALPCGTYGTKTTCGAVRDLTASEIYDSCFGPSSGSGSYICPALKPVRRVFVLSYKYDSAIGHFLTEVLPRIAYHYELLQDKSIFIHYGCDKKFQNFNPPLRFLEVSGS